MRSVVFASLIAACVCAEGAQAPLDRSELARHVVIVVADDVSPDLLRCYSTATPGAIAPLPRTPHIDDLAAQGVRFTQCYAGGATETASRWALLTGQAWPWSVAPAQVTRSEQAPAGSLAQLFNRSGRPTAAVGKWGIEGSLLDPARAGFQDWVGFLHAGEETEFPAHLWRNDRPFAVPGNQDGLRAESAMTLFTRVATNFIRLHADRSFLLLVAPPRAEAPAAASNAPSTKPSQPAEPDADTAAVQPQIARGVERLDAMVGALLAQLRASQLESRAVVILTSDQGEQTPIPGSGSVAGEPVRAAPDLLRERALRVPLLVRWPGKIKSASVNEVPCTLADLMPTIAWMTGLTPPGERASRPPLVSIVRTDP
jgi:arylsulfatase A-like enzyme